jgi:hypothetical protein
VCFVGGDLNFLGWLVLPSISIGQRKEFEGLTLTVRNPRGWVVIEQQY